MLESRLNRRRFLKVFGTAAAAASVTSKAFSEIGPSVSIVVDPADQVAASSPATWALGQLTHALITRGIAVRREAKPEDDRKGSLCIIAAGSESAVARQLLKGAGASVASAPESLGLVIVSHQGKPALLACGYDSRGLAYALTELADLTRNSPNPVAALEAIETTIEQPANEVRSITRLFCSDVEDKPWYNDRAMWPQYFDMLATERFNRFNLAFGIGYDFIRNVTDAYFLFTYPFLLKVPGYNVLVPQLTDAERGRNLDMLKFISEQCAMRGLEFHVGLWMHGYEWIDSPDANYTIEGLDKHNHGPYCRDAVKMLLQEVPNIHGLTFRIHGESGVQEGSFEFWKTVFDGVASCGRRVAIDMHTKGMSQQMIEIALDTRQPVTMSPKFWGEHMGMPYHQADIRKLEKPKSEDKPGLMALSEGTQSFLRYGYGDLLSEDRKWNVVHRIWPGSQRILLWGDPSFAAAYSRAFSFCGSNGVEIMEPLSFKGRRGSGHPGGRCSYVDPVYNPHWDWQKFEYATRVWGRMCYNPETRPEVWRRSLQTQFGPAAVAIENALANVSRILPIVTTSYAPSAGNNTYWPELYYNQSMTDAEHYGPYGDSLPPRVFGNASPFDPELFLSINEYADELFRESVSGKYSHVEVARWIEDFATAGRAALRQAETSATGRDTATFRRMKVDIEIQAGLGEFYAAKFRSGVLFHLFEITSEQVALQSAIALYQKARAAWAEVVDVSKNIYTADLTVGEQTYLRGHWSDRLPAIDKDIESLRTMLKADLIPDASPKLAKAMRLVLDGGLRDVTETHHLPPPRFKRGEALSLSLIAPQSVTTVSLRYRHVNQAEMWVEVAMERHGLQWSASIPGDYTNSAFPLQYYFRIISDDGSAALHPGISPHLTHQPYLVVRSI